VPRRRENRRRPEDLGAKPAPKPWMFVNGSAETPLMELYVMYSRSGRNSEGGRHKVPLDRRIICDSLEMSGVRSRSACSMQAAGLWKPPCYGRAPLGS